MRIDLELEDVYLGWEGSSLSDDLKIVLRTDNTTHEMTASLRELLRLYYYVSNKESCDLPIGTGKSIHVKQHGSFIKLRKPPLDLQTTFDELESALETLLAEIFTQKDRMSEAETRKAELNYLLKYLDDKGERLDIYEIYDSLSE